LATDATQRANQRQRRSDGERSHETILRAAAQLATVEGIDGLSLGRLAEHIGMSKSGLFAHFGSKEELQLATVEKAQEVFTAEVVAPALAEADGLRRVEALGERFLSHVEREVFAGGCFFASVSAEVDTRPGAVRELIVAVQHGWWEMIESAVKTAQESGELDPHADSRQLTFELNAMLTQGNASWLIFRDRSAFDNARRGFAGCLERAHPVRPG
jgi:AcrR family transcriptional regulator